MSVTRRYLVTGKVQGVGFRYFVLKVANLLKLAGWVRNLEDGSVEAVATGTHERLDRFAAQLYVGPPRADVRHVRVEPAATDGKIEGFHIR